MSTARFDMVALLNILVAHLDQHDLTDTVHTVEIRRGEFILYTTGSDRGMAATLAQWADSLGEVTLTAQPSSSGYDYVHVTMTGQLADHPIEVRWTASGADAAGLRHLLGIAERPTFSLNLAALAGLHDHSAAAA